MATPGAALKDFFVSYNRADRVWAEWIAWQLEAAGYTTIIQAWDFHAGGNFILEMDQAAKTTHHTLAVFSPEYLAALYTQPEWAAALVQDPTSAKQVLLPVRVRECKPQGLLAAIVYIDLVGLTEDEARKHLLSRASGKRGKPTVAPAFPGMMSQALAAPPAFPGMSQPPTQPPLWLMPHRRNPYFTGRNDTLAQVHAAFAAKAGIVTQALTGLGGIGKTQTAVEYAYRYRQDYQAIFWVQAETRELLIGDLTRIAALLQLPEREAQQQEVIVAAVTRWLEAQPGWLLVLDNVEDAALAREPLPTQGQGHVLLTARAQALGALDRATPLQALPADEAARFLLRRANRLAADALRASTPPEQQTQARAIAKALGGLTLALDQAGGYIEETGCALADYLALFQTRRKALLGSRGTDAQGHPDPVAVTWSVAFEQVEQASPAAADLLRLCAFLHPDAIPEDLFRDGMEALPPALQEAVNDPLQWNEALKALRRYSLIERQPETQTLALHRLVQAVLQDVMPDDERREWAEYAVRLVSAAFPFIEFVTWPRCQQLLPHALICAEHIEAWHLTLSEAARLLNQTGFYLRERAQYVEALLLYQRALAIDEQTLGPTHPSVSAVLNNLADIYDTQGLYAKALPLYQRALAIDEQAYGPNHPDVAQGLNNLAELYRAQREYAEALPLHQRALEIREEVLGPTHPDVAVSLNNLAVLYEDQGQHGESLPLKKRALAIWEQTLGPTHPLVAAGLSNLAVFYYSQRQYEEALPLLQRALAIREQALGSTHPGVAEGLNNLAMLYKTQGQYEEALPLYQRALAIWERALGPDHPTVALCLENLASLLRDMGQLKQASEYAARAQDIRARRKAAGM